MLRLELVAFTAHLICRCLHFIHRRGFPHLTLTALTDGLEQRHTAECQHETKDIIKGVGLY